MLRSISLCACLSVLLGTAALAAPPERAASGEFVAVKLARPPVIDGKVAPGEWDGALTTSAVLAAFDQRILTAATEMSVGFDAQRWYFLFRCVRSAGEWRLAKSVRTNDDYSFGDPSVEVWVAPPKRVPETYQSVINTYPAVLDLHMIPSRGYTAQGWKGNWNIAVTEDPDQYIIEASIPFADFGIEQVKDGDVWKLLLCRSALGAFPRPQGSWGITTAFSEIPQYPTVRLAFDDVSVQWRGAHTLLRGDYAMPLTLVAPAAKDANVNVELRFHKAATPGDASDIVQTKRVSLKAGGRQTIDLAGKVPADWTGKVTIARQQQDAPVGHATVTVTREGGGVLFRQTIPYAAIGWKPARPNRPANAPPPKELGLMAKYGPQSNVILLRADILEMPTRDKVAGGTIRVLDPDAGDKELLRKPLPRFIESYSDAHVQLTGIEIPVHDYAKQEAAWAEIKCITEHNRDVGKRVKAYKEREEAAAKRAGKPAGQVVVPDEPQYKKLSVPEPPPLTPARKLVVEVAVADASGKVLATERQELSLLRTQFAWQNNTLGISDKVLPPWTPITVSAEQMGVWNRKMQVDGLGLLKSIDNGGTAQVKSMRLVAIKDGREAPITAGPANVAKQTDAAVTFTGEGTGAGLKLTSSNKLEFDGYVLSDLTIAPAGTQASLDKLYLEVVLPESEATHMCATAGGWAALHDETPAYWSSQQTSSGAIIGDFVPYIWLTNSDRAFLWVADSDKGWITEDQRKVATQEIIRKDGTVTLRINFIEIPATLKGPTTVRYAYQTFPARPLPAGWRSWVCANGAPAGAPSSKIQYFYPNFEGTDWVINWPYYGSPFPHSWERSKAYFDRFASQPRFRPTVGAIAHSIGFYRDYEGRQFNDYAVDWGEMPGQLGNCDVTQSRGPIDFRVYYYDQWVRKSGMKALYIDENYIAMDRNHLTGGAYLRDDGRLQPGYTYLGLREYYKRLNHVLHDAGAAKPNLWMHISSGSAYHAWLGDIFMEGENVGPSDEEFDYLEVLPAARMRAIGSAKVNGGAMLMMCQANRHTTPLQEKHIHQFVGWVQAHDILPEQVLWHAPIAEAARFYRDDVEFVGYWHAHVPLKATTPDAIASVHKTAGRALVWIVNMSRQDRTVDVAIDWAKLGLDRARTIALNAETGKEIALTPAGLSVPTLKRDFVAVHLVQRNRLEAGQSFLATFDNGPAADEALGSEVLEGPGELVAGERGKALAVGGGVTLWSHLNLSDTEGRLSFRGKFAGTPGVVLKTSTPGVRKGETPLGPGLVLEVVGGRGGQPAELVLRLDEKDGQRIAMPAPAAGWRTVKLTWKDGQMGLAVDDQAAAGALPVKTLNVLEGTGPDLTRVARFTFGGQRSAIDAIDDLSAWRKAD